jgi:hypothetical protein
MRYYLARSINLETGQPWYEVRTKDSWVSILHEDDRETLEEALQQLCLWSATQQNEEEGPVWPIAHEFTDGALATEWLDRERKQEPNHKYYLISIAVTMGEDTYVR